MSPTSVRWAARLDAVNGWISLVIYSNGRWFDCLKHILYTVSSLSPCYTRDSRQDRNSSCVDMHYGRVSGGTFVLDGLIRALNINPRIISAAWPGMARHGALLRHSGIPTNSSPGAAKAQPGAAYTYSQTSLSSVAVDISAFVSRCAVVVFSSVSRRRIALSLLLTAIVGCRLPGLPKQPLLPLLLHPSTPFSNYFILLFT